jgi:hypothetical protein
MPGLLTLKTDLKSLKYGHDQPNGGDSSQPYIKVDINTVDDTFNRVRLTKFDDGLVRGGTVGALNASVVDTLRISKFFADFSKGPLFVTKQVGLQLSNPRLEIPKNPANIAAGGLQNQLAASTNGILQPTRVYNLGLNTLAQIPSNAFGVHFDRHGLSPIQNNASKYEAVVTANNEGVGSNNNRLVGLLSKFANNPSETVIDKYSGGPGSVYGIGNTIIHRAENRITNDKLKIEAAYDRSKSKAGFFYDPEDGTAFNTIQNRFLGVSNKESSSFVSGTFAPGIPITLDDRNSVNNIDNDKTGVYHWNSQTPVQSIKIVDTFDYDLSAEYSYSPLARSGSTFDLSKEIDPNQPLFKNEGSNKDKNNPYKRDSGVDIDNTNDLVTNGPTSYPGLNNTTPRFKSELDLPNDVYQQYYTSPSAKTYATIQNIVNSGTINKQKADTHLHRNAPDFKYNNGKLKYDVAKFKRTNDRVEKDDTLALEFTPIDPFTANNLSVLKFLAYITDYTDNFDSSWNDVKYVGRAEKFYIFNEFKRSISLGFNIPCFTPTELEQKHQKLNKLVSILAGKYGGSNNILLGGIITKLKVGNYIDNQPGIINSLNFSPIQDGSWDLNDKLAFYIKVSFNFTVIHNFLPEYNQPFITVPTGSIGTNKSSVSAGETTSYSEVTFGRQTTSSIGF